MAGHAHGLARHPARMSEARGIAAKKRAKLCLAQKKPERRSANSADQLMRHELLEVLPISKLQPSARNARVHSKKQAPGFRIRFCASDSPTRF